MAQAVRLSPGQDVSDGRRRRLEGGRRGRLKTTAPRRPPCYQDGAEHLGSALRPWTSPGKCGKSECSQGSS